MATPTISANAALISERKMDLSAHGIDTLTPIRGDTEAIGPSYAVLGIECRAQNLAQVQSILKKWLQQNPDLKVIVWGKDLTTRDVIQLNNDFHPLIITLEPELNTDRLVSLYQTALAQHYKEKQEIKLVELIHDKNEELKKLMIALEEKIEQRQLALESAQQKNDIARRRLSTLQKTLMQIYPATSIAEVEHGIRTSLQNDFKIANVRIRTHSQSNLNEKRGEIKFFEVPLRLDQKDFGYLIFFKDKTQNFDQKEKRFLSQVAEAASLTIERIIQYQKSQELKRQWETTFDAISDPVCITDQDYNIVRVNSPFLKKVGSPNKSDRLGEKCYQALFKRQEPCLGCQRGTPFKVRNIKPDNSSEVYEVASSPLSGSDQTLYFQMYRDITQDLNLERQVIESAKMAELGTISSSIAHELNNPIGGMLNFAQLMKMDLSGEEPYYNDILEIEKGIVKCKNIVKNLLGFSRQSLQNDQTEVSLHEVIDQAIKITELKTRAIGIRIDYQKPHKDFLINGRFNLLTHAVRNILQNSQESLIEKRKKNSQFSGLISIELLDQRDHFEIVITDNGEAIDEKDKHRIFDPLYTTKDPETNSGLGLTLALQIVREHNGGIDVTISKDKKMSMHLRFSKPQGQSGQSRN